MKKAIAWVLKQYREQFHVQLARMENANKQVLQASEALEGPEAEIKKREAKMYHIKQAIDEAMKI